MLANEKSLLFEFGPADKMDKLELFLTPLSSETSSPSPATSVSQPPKDSNAQSLRGRWQFVCCLMNDVDEVSSNFLLSPNTLEWAFREEYLDIIEYDFGNLLDAQEAVNQVKHIYSAGSQ